MPSGGQCYIEVTSRKLDFEREPVVVQGEFFLVHMKKRILNQFISQRESIPRTAFTEEWVGDYPSVGFS